MAINYISNRERAEETAGKIEKEYGVRTVIIQGVCVLLLLKGDWEGGGGGEG